MILCLGSAADLTFMHTVETLKDAAVPFHALDLAQLAYSGLLEIPLDDVRAAHVTLHGRRYPLGSYDAAYLRMLGLTDGAPEERLVQRSIAQYRALTQTLACTSTFLVNPPGGDVFNAAKLLHAVSLAPLAGWRIPRSCLTSSPKEARAFVDTCPAGAIYKGTSGIRTTARAYDPAVDDERLALLVESPVLFQERIVGPDVRVHAVGPRVFGELIDSRGLDYRYAKGNRYRPIDPPPEIAAGCLALARECGKPFLGFDFKIDRATDDWYFLEANPQPGYDYFDRRAGGAIARALVELLADPSQWTGSRQDDAALGAVGA